MHPGHGGAGGTWGTSFLHVRELLTELQPALEGHSALFLHVGALLTDHWFVSDSRDLQTCSEP